MHHVRDLSDELSERLRHRSSGGFPDAALVEGARAIFDAVRERDDDAVLELTKRFDGVELDHSQLIVEEREFDEAIASLSSEVASAIDAAIENQRRYNEALLPRRLELFDIGEGVVGGRRVTPLQRVALYVPSGKGSYPSTFITIAVPAVVAGVAELEVIVPPRPDGRIDPAILAAARTLGIDRVFRANGVAGIAAAALGTPSLPRVDKIVGPGGPMIMAAEVYAQLQGIAVALFFGPSECMIIADETADPELVAADLVNEAEHGPESSAILITTSQEVAEETHAAVLRQIEALPSQRHDFARSALEQYGALIVVDHLDEAVELANDWANEHIQIVTQDPWSIVNRLHSASEILVGQDTTFSAISYAIGVPACLPTGQFARTYSPVTVDTFMRSAAVAALSPAGLASLAPTIIGLAKHEGFAAHVRSITLREELGVLRGRAVREEESSNA